MTRSRCFCDEVLASLHRIEALLAGAPAPGDPLAAALSETFARSCFTASEAIEEARRQEAEAGSLGLALPALPEALRRAGIAGPRQLGRYLADSRDFQVVARDRAGAIWAAVPDRLEASPPVRRSTRRGNFERT